VSEVTEWFLRSPDARVDDLQGVLARLGETVGASRVYLFENFVGPDGELWTGQRSEWTAETTPSEDDNPDVQGLPWLEGGMGRWIGLMRQGEIVAGHVREFPASEQAVLAPQEIQSILAVPIFVSDEWWGFIGFDECHEERTWSGAEIEGLRLAASVIGAMIERRSSESRASAMHGLAIKLAGMSSLPAALKLCLDTALSVSQMDCGGVYLVHPDSGAVELCESVGFSEQSRLAVERYDADSPQAAVVRAGQPHYVRYVDLPFSQDELTGTERLRACAIIPIVAKGRPIACLNLASRSIDEFPVKSRRILESMAAQISTVIARIQAESMLRRRQDELEAFFNTIDDFVFVLDATGTILLTNRTAEKRLGRTREELVGQPVVMVHPAERADEARRVVAEMVAGKRETCPVPLLTKDGSLIPVETRVTPGRWGDQPVLFGVSRDVSERERTEQEMLKVQKLESIGLLAGGIAHDFNNILTSLLGHISLAQLSVDPDAKASCLLARAEFACTRAADLTKQLLTFSRGGAPVRKTASVAKLVESTVEFALHGSNVRLSLAIGDDTWPAEIDEGQISQAINNIVINAQQAMPAGGTVWVSTENVTIPDEECREAPLTPGDYVRISVADEGGGIDPAVLPRVFDPYFTTKSGGSGLGLASCYSVVKNHDGHVEVTSEVGEGTTFHIHLPASAQALAQEDPDVGPVPGQGRVLVMDDDDGVARTLEAVLEQLGYDVTLCSDGQEASRLYAEALDSRTRFDVVLLDLTVRGGLGGHHTLQEIRTQDPDVKAIVCSGYSEDPILAAPEKFGFAGRIAKPFRLKECAAELRRVLGTS